MAPLPGTAQRCGSSPSSYAWVQAPSSSQCRKTRLHLRGAEPARVMSLAIRNYPGVRTPTAPSCNRATLHGTAMHFFSTLWKREDMGPKSCSYTEIITVNPEQMSHTTYNNDKVQLFCCLPKALMTCRKTLQFSWLPPSLYHLFQIHYKPTKPVCFQNQTRILFSVSFPLSCKETTSHLLLPFTAVYVGTGDSSGHSESLRHHRGATETPGLASPPTVFAPSAPIAEQSRVSGFSCLEHHCLLI